jgi:hypothetical protein
VTRPWPIGWPTPVYDTFTYTVTDPLGEQCTATVTIHIYDPYYIP